MQNTSTLWTVGIIFSALVSLLTVRWAYFKILKIAKDKNVVDNPDARKLQKTPVPVMGGVAVFIGVVAGTLVGAALTRVHGLGTLTMQLPVILAMLVMLYTGSMDDIVGLSPGSRFVIEICTLLGLIFASGCCVDSLHGLWGVDDISWWVAVPLTVLGGVGIINAVNMIDGVNGLSSGLCITCCILFGTVFSLVGDMVNAMLAFVMGAALLPFLLHNVFGMRSKMFIGDAGTMVMGMLMTWFTISVLYKGSDVAEHLHAPNANLIAMALAILSVPVFDTVRVMFMRILKRQSPFHPDKTHLHHVFINVGVSHTITALFEIGINLIIVGVWVLTVWQGAGMDWQLYIVIAVSLLFVWGTYFFLRGQVNRHTNFMHRLAHFSISTHLGSRKWWQKIEYLLDRREEVEQEQSEQQLQAASFHITFGDDPNNFKEIDRRKVLEFMKGKAEVFVNDIKDRSGAERLRVDALLSEGELEGYIKVITRSNNGAPVIVALADDVTF